ncbi:MAG TPA: hypothetical protein VEM41_09450 [Actinomycetota bacterium]|nr:hypothetical protein [Actinomycetota bacterium]
MDDTTRRSGGHEAAGTKKKSGETTPAAHAAAGGSARAKAARPATRRAAPEAVAGAERWLFAVVGAGDVAAGTVRHTAERTRVMMSGGRRGAAANTSAAVDRLAARGRVVMGEVSGTEGVQAMTRRAESARKRFETISSNIAKAASNAVEAGKAFRRAS